MKIKTERRALIKRKNLYKKYQEEEEQAYEKSFSHRLYDNATYIYVSYIFIFASTIYTMLFQEVHITTMGKVLYGASLSYILFRGISSIITYIFIPKEDVGIRWVAIILSLLMVVVQILAWINNSTGALSLELFEIQNGVYILLVWFILACIEIIGAFMIMVFKK